MSDQRAVFNAEVIQVRGAMYSFLAEIYSKEVDADALERLRKVQMEGDADASSLAVDMQVIRDYVTTDASNEEIINALAVDFANVFLGANSRTDGAYPYESVYTSPEGLLCRESTDEVLHAYRLEGFGQSMHYNVPDDHLSLEFSFMVQLVDKMQKALNAGDAERAELYAEKQAAFFAEHLQPWVSQFCSKGKDLAKTGFYTSILNITEVLMVSEAELLNS